MSVRDLAASPADETAHADVCVVGAGIAGLLLGTRLARAGRRVVILESGRERPGAAHDALNEVEDPSGLYVGGTAGRTRALGGTSSLWGGRMLPLADSDMAARPDLDVPGWPIAPADLAPYGREIERLFGVDEGTFESDFLAASGAPDPFPAGDPDFRARWPKWPDLRRCNLAILLRREIADAAGAGIWTDATVHDLVLDAEAGRLTGVVAVSLSGRRLVVSAPEIVVCAGTIESTRLLLWLHALSNDRAFAASPALGRYFQDHLSTAVGDLQAPDRSAVTRLFGYRFLGSTRRNLHLETTAAAQAADGTGSAFVQIAIEPSGASALNVVKNFLRSLQRREFDLPAAQVLRLAGDLPNLARLAAWRYGRRQLYLPADTALRVSAVVEQRPIAANRIRLAAARDATGLPKAALDWRVGVEDLRAFEAVSARIDAYWKRAGFDRTCPIRWDMTNGAPGRVVPSRGLDISHPSGTIRMGTDPRLSVVDARLRCHAVPNLRVVGAATFPRAGSANPTYTIMQLALRAADDLAGASAAARPADRRAA